MSPRLILLACAALGGCAGLARPDLPICDGANRRPANPHGSILMAPAPISPAPSAGRPAEPTPAPMSPEAASGGCA